jgi:membrane protein involved in colicin uptake
LSGRLAAQVEEHGEAIGYDDGYRGMDEEWARKKATEEAQRKTAAATRAQVEGAKRQAEAEASGEISSRAEAKARETLDRKAQALRRELDEQARQQLAAVGALGRQEFHRALGQAYRRTLLAYARTHQAEIVSDSDSGDTIEIELLVQR